jgi:pimeloyl-ACP methyl ester carboxylesterase
VHRAGRAWLLALVPIAFLGLLVVWAQTSLGPMPEAQSALQSDAQVTVQTSPWLSFRPGEGEPRTGLIFYPGGRVDPRAYAPPARAIAAAGYLVVVVPMPLNLAVLAPDRATRVLGAYPEIGHWAVGGHSLGGAMAARFANRFPDAVQGLVLWAAYPAGSDDLSGRDIAVVSISGTLDGLATGQEIAASRPLLPAKARWVTIEGGNHAQFAWYGPQRGDNQAVISRLVQQEQVVQATVALLGRVEGEER